MRESSSWPILLCSCFCSAWIADSEQKRIRRSVVDKLHGEDAPDRAVVRGTFHGTDLVINTGVRAFWQQGLRCQDQVDAQASLRVTFETANSVIEPAEAVTGSREKMAPRIPQMRASHQAVQPLALFGKETAFAGAQPALAIVLADTYIVIKWGHIHVAHHNDVILAWQDTQVCCELLVKTRLIGKLCRVV